MLSSARFEGSWVPIALLLATNVARAEPAEFSVRVPAPEHFRLQNGLDVVVQAAPHQTAVAVVVEYDVGARDDPEGYEQLAHLVEHMTFESSRHLGTHRGVELLERAGLRDYNGTTGLDGTSYHAVVPAQALPLALWIESERMAFTLERFDSARLDHHRAVVRNELFLRKGPEQTLLWQFLRSVYGSGHPYAKSAHDGADLDAIDLDDAAWFFQQGYRPSNAHLVVVGDIDPPRAVAQVHKYFGPIVDPKVPLARRTSQRAPFASNGYLRVEAPIHLRQLLVAWPAPPLGSPQRPAAEILTRLLATRFEDRLLHANREVHALRFEILDLELGSMLFLHALLTSYTNLDDLETAIQRELATISDDELATLLPETKARVLLDELHAIEDPLELAQRHVAALRHQRRPYQVEKRIAELRAVSLAELLRYRRSLASAKTVVAALVRGPTEKVVSGGVD
jgi:predicted Zn-dependent peptidase